MLYFYKVVGGPGGYTSEVSWLDKVRKKSAKQIVSRDNNFN